MALSAVVRGVLLVVFVTVLQNGRSMALRIDTSPEACTAQIDIEMSISCTPDDSAYSVKKIQTLQLVKGDKPIAILRHSGVTMGARSKSYMKADGNIKKGSSGSFLKVTIKNLEESDFGTYTCIMFYEDQALRLKEEKSEIYVSNDKKTCVKENSGRSCQEMTCTPPLVTSLAKKFSNLEKKVQDQEILIRIQKDTNAKQEKLLMEHENDNDLLHRMLKRVVDLESYTKDLNINLLKQQNFISDLKKTVKDQGKQLVDQDKKESFISAFSVNGTMNEFHGGETMLFQQSLMNVGNNYNMGAGVYTAPRKGLYIFHLTLWTVHGDYFGTHLMVNKVVRASLVAYDKDHFQQTTLSEIVSLEALDKVSIHVYNAGKLVNLKEKFPIFSGYLLKLL